METVYSYVFRLKSSFVVHFCQNGTFKIIGTPECIFKQYFISKFVFDCKTNRGGEKTQSRHGLVHCLSFPNRRFSSAGVQASRVAPEHTRQENEEESHRGLQKACGEEALRPRRRPAGQSLRRGAEKSLAEEESRAQHALLAQQGPNVPLRN